MVYIMCVIWYMHDIYLWYMWYGSIFFIIHIHLSYNCISLLYTHILFWSLSRCQLKYLPILPLTGILDLFLKERKHQMSTWITFMTHFFGGFKYDYKENSTFLVSKLTFMARISLINSGELAGAFSLASFLCGPWLLPLRLLCQYWWLFFFLLILQEHHHPHHHHYGGFRLRWHDFRRLIRLTFADGKLSWHSM